MCRNALQVTDASLQASFRNKSDDAKNEQNTYVLVKAQELYGFITGTSNQRLNESCKQERNNSDAKTDAQHHTQPPAAKALRARHAQMCRNQQMLKGSKPHNTPEVGWSPNTADRMTTLSLQATSYECISQVNLRPQLLKGLVLELGSITHDICQDLQSVLQLNPWLQAVNNIIIALILQDPLETSSKLIAHMPRRHSQCYQATTEPCISIFAQQRTCLCQASHKTLVA
eukprot:2912081-Amphidinium_carterae.3